MGAHVHMHLESWTTCTRCCLFLLVRTCSCLQPLCVKACQESSCRRRPCPRGTVGSSYWQHTRRCPPAGIRPTKAEAFTASDLPALQSCKSSRHQNDPLNAQACEPWTAKAYMRLLCKCREVGEQESLVGLHLPDGHVT